MTMTRRRTAHHGRRRYDRRRPRGRWNPWGVGLVLVVAAMVIARHYGISITIHQ
jgi:hypothetical protein